MDDPRAALGLSADLAGLLAADRQPLAATRAEMASAAFAMGSLACDAVAGALDRTPLRRDVEQRLASAIYALMRTAAAAGIDIDAAIAAEIGRRNAAAALLAAQGDRVARSLPGG